MSIAAVPNMQPTSISGLATYDSLASKYKGARLGASAEEVGTVIGATGEALGPLIQGWLNPPQTPSVPAPVVQTTAPVVQDSGFFGSMSTPVAIMAGIALLAIAIGAVVVAVKVANQ